MIIGAMQSCETYDDTSNETFHANLISGYPRDMDDMKDYTSRVMFLNPEILPLWSFVKLQRIDMFKCLPLSSYNFLIIDWSLRWCNLVEMGKRCFITSS